MKTEALERMLVSCRSTRFPSQTCVEQATDELAAIRTELAEAQEQLRLACESTHRQAACMHQCAAHIGPDTDATIEGLPRSVKFVCDRLAEAREALGRAEIHKDCCPCDRCGYIEDACRVCGYKCTCKACATTPAAESANTAEQAMDGLKADLAMYGQTIESVSKPSNEAQQTKDGK